MVKEGREACWSTPTSEPGSIQQPALWPEPPSSTTSPPVLQQLHKIQNHVKNPPSYLQSHPQPPYMLTLFKFQFTFKVNVWNYISHKNCSNLLLLCQENYMPLIKKRLWHSCYILASSSCVRIHSIYPYRYCCFINIRYKLHKTTNSTIIRGVVTFATSAYASQHENIFSASQTFLLKQLQPRKVILNFWFFHVKVPLVPVTIHKCIFISHSDETSC